MLLTTAAAAAAAALPRLLFCVSSSPFHLVRAIAVDIVTYFCRLRLSLSFLAQLIHSLLFCGCLCYCCSYWYCSCCCFACFNRISVALIKFFTHTNSQNVVELLWLTHTHTITHARVKYTNKTRSTGDRQTRRRRAPKIIFARQNLKSNWTTEQDASTKPSLKLRRRRDKQRQRTVALGRFVWLQKTIKNCWWWLMVKFIL